MNRFLKNNLIFMLPIFLAVVIAFIPMEILLENIPNDYSFKKEYLDENSDSIEILVLGSSHSYYGINPIYFHLRAFNASHISQSLDFDYKILQKYDRKWKKLQYIIIPISYFSLFGKLETGIENWRVKNYAIYYGMKSSNIFDNTELLSNNFSVNFTRIKSYYLAHENNISCAKNGWGLTYNSKNH